MKSPIRLAAFAFAALCAALSPATAQGQCISFTGPTYTQNFDTLVNSGAVLTNPISVLPGWALNETGGSATRDNEAYAVDNGGSNTGDTYSYGTAAATDRALGSLQSGSLAATYGFCVTNNSGSTLVNPQVAYAGEQWRLGTTGRVDRLDFQYSTNATSLTTGTWLDANALDFTAPLTAGALGAKDGNLVANRTALSAPVTGLSIPNGSTVWIRFVDFDASGAEDGLGVDDLTFGAGAPVNQAIAPSCPSSILVLVGNAGSANVSATDPDGIVNAATITTILPVNPGTITLGSFVPAGAAGGTATAVLSVSAMTPVGTYAVTVQWSNADGIPQTATCTTSFQVGSFAVTPINQIQGPGVTTPLLGQTHTTRGIVTGLKSNGFFLQTPDASVDANNLTSEGIFVFTGAAPPAGAVKGADVLVTGTVTEFKPDPGKPPLTEIGQPGFVFQGVFSNGNPLPAPVVITAAETQVNSLENLERREGMRVSIPSLTAISPTTGDVTEPSATSSTNGRFFGVVTGVARPFRERGVENDDPLPSGSPATVTRFDANPERIQIDSDFQAGAPTLNLNAGAVVTGIVGPLDYSFGAWTVYPDPVPAAIIATNPSPVPAPAPTRLEFTVGSYNMERFFDTNNDPAIGEPVLTAPAYDGRLNKASLAIRNFLRSPDILGVMEIESLSVLQTIAAKVNADAILAGQPNPLYQSFLVEGNDVGGIDVGFLVKGALASADPVCAPAAAGTKVDVVDVTQVGKTTTFLDPSVNAQRTLNDRPPLVLRAIAHGCTGVSYPITVIANHLRSLGGVDSEDPDGLTTEGNRVRQKRKAQAEFLADLVQTRQALGERVLVLGDLNAFEFSDGLVDVTGTIVGNPVPASQVVLATSDLVNPNLVNLLGTSPAAEQYSYSFDGNAQTLDHILASTTLTSTVLAYRLEHPRFDADFGALLRNDTTVATRLSDHDPGLAYFTLGSAPAMTAGAAVARVQGESATSTVATVSDPDTGPGSVTVTVVPGGTATGITLTSIVNTAGTVTATVTASCTATSGTVRLRATDPQGFFVETLLTVNVTANVLNATLTLPPPACTSTSVMASVPDNGAGVTYTWLITNGTITAGQGTRTVTFTTGASGSTNVAVTVSRFACSATSTGSVSTTSLVPPTILGVEFSGAIAPTNVCQGAPFTLQATAGYTLYQWYRNGNPIMGATASTYSVASAAPGNSGDYTVTGSLGGCVSAQSLPFSIGVGPCAAPTITSLTKSCANVTGGLAITINGTGFQEGATVTLAGVAATVNSVTPTAIAVTTGSKAASPAVTGNVVVTNPDTQSATLTNGFTYAVRGDANNNGALTGADAAFLRIAVFLGGAQPATLCNGDANSNGAITGADSFFLDLYIFLGGVPPGP